MLNILASITIAENEQGELGVGVDLQVNETTLRKLQELMPKLANDICSLKIEDVESTIQVGKVERVEKEIKNILKTIDIDKYLREDMELIKEEFLAQTIIPKKIIEGGN